MIKRLAKCINGYWKNAILTPVFVMMEVIMDILIPYVMTFLLQCFQADVMDVKKVLLYGAALLLMSLTALVFGALSGAHCAKASSGFAANMRKDMFYALQDYSFGNIDKFSPASIVTRMTTDVNFVQQAFMMIIRMAVRSPLMLIFGIIMCVAIGGKIAAIYAVVIPVMIVALVFIFIGASKYFKTLFKKYDKMNNIVEEDVRGMRVVKSNVREDYETEKFTSASEDIRKQFTKAQRIIVLCNPLMQLSMYVCITLVFYFGSKTIISTAGVDLDTSKLTTLVTYSSQILMSLMMFSFVFMQTVIAKASAERIYEVLTEVPEIKDKETPVMVVKDGSISFKNVSFSYAKDMEKLSLKGVNLEIKSGETIGIIGGTGSGKSTLVQLIPRLYDVTDGELYVGGVNVKDYDLEVLRKSVAMVLQKNVLFSGTIRENLQWGKEDATDEEINEAIRLACADEFVNRIGGLDFYVEQGGANLSGGQRQRLCIARALLASPKILVLDDSTSAVDMNTDKAIRKAFRESIPHTTKLIIAQRIASVMDADKIIVMENGRVDGFGTHEELMESNEIYREVYTSQVEAGGDFDESAGN